MADQVRTTDLTVVDDAASSDRVILTTPGAGAPTLINPNKLATKRDPLTTATAADVVANTADISANKAAIAVHTNAIEANRVATAENTAGVSTNKTAIAQNASAISAVIGTAAANAASVASARAIADAAMADTVVNADAINVNAAAIAANKDLITTNTAAIGALKATTDSHSTMVGALSSSVGTRYLQSAGAPTSDPPGVGAALFSTVLTVGGGSPYGYDKAFSKGGLTNLTFTFKGGSLELIQFLTLDEEQTFLVFEQAGNDPLLTAADFEDVEIRIGDRAFILSDATYGQNGRQHIFSLQTTTELFTAADVGNDFNVYICPLEWTASVPAYIEGQQLYAAIKHADGWEVIRVRHPDAAVLKLSDAFYFQSVNKPTGNPPGPALAVMNGVLTVGHNNTDSYGFDTSYGGLTNPAFVFKDRRFEVVQVFYQASTFRFSLRQTGSDTLLPHSDFNDVQIRIGTHTINLVDATLTSRNERFIIFTFELESTADALFKSGSAGSKFTFAIDPLAEWIATVPAYAPGEQLYTAIRHADGWEAVRVRHPDSPVLRLDDALYQQRATRPTRDPDQGGVEIFSSELTVGLVDSNIGFSAGNYGALSMTTFTYKGQDFTVKDLAGDTTSHFIQVVQGGSDALLPDADFSSLILRVGDREFAGTDGAVIKRGRDISILFTQADPPLFASTQAGSKLAVSLHPIEWQDAVPAYVSGEQLYVAVRRGIAWSILKMQHPDAPDLAAVDQYFRHGFDASGSTNQDIISRLNIGHGYHFSLASADDWGYVFVGEYVSSTDAGVRCFSAHLNQQEGYSDQVQITNFDFVSGVEIAEFLLFQKLTDTTAKLWIGHAPRNAGASSIKIARFSITRGALMDEGGKRWYASPTFSRDTGLHRDTAIDLPTAHIWGGSIIKDSSNRERAVICTEDHLEIYNLAASPVNNKIPRVARILLPGGKDHTGVGVDQNKRLLYTMDVGDRQLIAYSYATNANAPTLQSNVTQDLVGLPDSGAGPFEDIAIDAIHKRIYVTGEQQRGQLFVAPLGDAPVWTPRYHRSNDILEERRLFPIDPELLYFAQTSEKNAYKSLNENKAIVGLFGEVSMFDIDEIFIQILMGVFGKTSGGANSGINIDRSKWLNSVILNLPVFNGEDLAAVTNLATASNFTNSGNQVSDAFYQSIPFAKRITSILPATTYVESTAFAPLIFGGGQPNLTVTAANRAILSYTFLINKKSQLTHLLMFNQRYHHTELAAARSSYWLARINKIKVVYK